MSNTEKNEEKVVEEMVNEATSTDVTSQEQVESIDEVTEETVLSEEAQKIQMLEAENNALADKVLRAQAELQNVQKRQQKERGDLIRYRSQSLATALLPVLDSLEHALKVEVNDEQGTQLKKGLEMAYQNFLSNLESEGITKIKALGEKFDPTLHQAIQQVQATDEQEADVVAQVFQEGYQLHERVIRPAMVVVTTK